MKFTVKLPAEVPDLRKLLTTQQKRDLMQAWGAPLVRISQRSFDEAALRPAQWPARRDKLSHPLLEKSGELWRSIRTLDFDTDKVTVAGGGTGAPYGPIHMFGGVIPGRMVRTVEKTAKVMGKKTGMGRAVATQNFGFFGQRTTVKTAGQFWHPGAVIPARPYFPVDTATGKPTDYAERALIFTTRRYFKNAPLGSHFTA